MLDWFSPFNSLSAYMRSGSGALSTTGTSLNKCEISVYTVRIFMNCTHVCAAQKAYLLFIGHWLDKVYLPPGGIL